MHKGIVFNIQKFSINDGPGIRTTVFLKGCPLNCLWCHNPESKSIKKQLFYDARKCVGCGRCVSACEFSAHSFKGEEHVFDREKCTLCGKCVDVCPAGALEVVGEEKTCDEIIKEVLKDKTFYETSGGGMTLSGGEPLMQYDLCLSLLKKGKAAGLHICMETCGYAPQEHIREVAKYVDIFLFDYKLTSPAEHEKYTGVDNHLILSNLALLNELGAHIVLRCPIIPGINDTKEHLEGIAKIAEKFDAIMNVDIEPYHPLGSSKSDMLGIDYSLKHLSFPEEEKVDYWVKTVASLTSKPVKKA